MKYIVKIDLSLLDGEGVYRKSAPADLDTCKALVAAFNAALPQVETEIIPVEAAE